MMGKIDALIGKIIGNGDLSLDAALRSVQAGIPTFSDKFHFAIAARRQNLPMRWQNSLGLYPVTFYSSIGP